MNDKKQNINKKYYFRLRKYEIGENNSKNKNMALKREFDYQYLKDYDKMMGSFVNLIFEIRKKECGDRIPIIVLNHPEINEIYIYTKEQWDLYFKFNIIQECFNNHVLKAEYILASKEEIQKTYTGINKLIENKKEIIKYIIKNIPLKMHLNIILSFFKENSEIAKTYEKYFLDKILNCDVNKLNNSVENEITKNDDEILESNININNLKNEINFEAKKENKIHFDEEYYIHRKEFIQILDNQFEVFSKYQKSLDKINKILKEKENIISQNSEINIHSTSVNFQKDTSFNNIGLNDNNIDEEASLISVLNPPKQYIKDLLNDDKKFFKKLNKKEYFDGLIQYKDQLTRDFIQMFSKNT